jgi:hypothetical protein
MLSQWSVYVNAGIPVCWLSTHEEARAEAALAATAQRMPGEPVCAVWSLTSAQNGTPGWEPPAGWPTPLPEDWCPDARIAASPHAALLHMATWCEQHDGRTAVCVVRDAHTFCESPQWRRAVKDLTRRLRATQGRLVLLSYRAELPPDMRSDVPLLTPGLPCYESLLRQCRDTLAGLDCEADAARCADALRGLGLREAKDSMLCDYVEHSSVDSERLSAFKARELSKVSGIKYVGEVESISDVGGLEVLREDLADYQGSLTREADDFGCDPPKGFMLSGVPGAGKSLFGRAAANALGLPLVELSPSECEGGLVGETGSRFRTALRTIDAISPCVVLIDEGEKAFGSGGERDSGSKETLRLEFLRWAQNRRGRVFVIMTCNDPSKLPAEMKRKGRWDESYFVDLPHAEERRAIILVHLRKRRRQLPESALEGLVAASEGFTGAEIESGVAKAVRRCYREQQRDLTAADVLSQFESTTPQSAGEQIKALRQWAKEQQARLASRPAPRSHDTKAKEPARPRKLIADGSN